MIISLPSTLLTDSRKTIVYATSTATVTCRKKSLLSPCRIQSLHKMVICIIIYSTHTKTMYCKLRVYREDVLLFKSSN